jgi:hypothetical protein
MCNGPYNAHELLNAAYAPKKTHNEEVPEEPLEQLNLTEMDELYAKKGKVILNRAHGVGGLNGCGFPLSVKVKKRD